MPKVGVLLLNDLAWQRVGLGCTQSLTKSVQLDLQSDLIGSTWPLIRSVCVIMLDCQSFSTPPLNPACPSIRVSPESWQRRSSIGAASSLVIMLARFSLLWIRAIASRWLATSSHKKKCAISMCFVLLKCCGLLAIAHAPDESLYRTGTFQSKLNLLSWEWMIDIPALTCIPVVVGADCLNLLKNIMVQINSLAAPASATYSASTELFATVGWSLDDQLHMSPSIANMYPEVNLQQLHDPAQSLSAQPASIGSLIGSLAERLILIVPFRYLRIHFAAARCSPEGFAMNHAQHPTAKAMSGLLPCAIHSSDPTSNT